MSKLWKGVKKTFKKVTKFVKKNWKYIAIAVAIYFTAGMALAAMPSTAAFSAAMPGFGVGGMFSNAAVAMGATGAAGSGIAGTVAANAAGTALIGGATLAGPASAIAAPGSVVGTTAGAVTTAGLGAAPVASTVAAGAATTGSTTAATVGAMSGLEKVALASTVFSGASGLLSDSEDDIRRKNHNRNYGQSFGVGRNGQGPTWEGAASDAFAGKFGTAEGVGNAPPEEGEAEGGSPFYADSTQNGSEPFSDMSYGEEAAQQSQQAVTSGYKNKNYKPAAV